MNFRLKRIVFSTILFAASAVHTSSYAQATREEIFDNIAVTGGVYYAYPAPGVQTKAPKGYEPFYISHFGRHGSRWLMKCLKRHIRQVNLLRWAKMCASGWLLSGQMPKDAVET